MMRAFISAHEIMLSGLAREAPLDLLLEITLLEEFSRLNETPAARFPACADELLSRLSGEVGALAEKAEAERRKFTQDGKPEEEGEDQR